MFFLFKKYPMKTSSMKLKSNFLKLAYSLGEINTIQKMIWEYFQFKELAI